MKDDIADTIAKLIQDTAAKIDEKCLELAKSIRIVLTELAIRSAQVLKDKAELKSAVNRLLKKKTGKKNLEDDKPQG